MYRIFLLPLLLLVASAGLGHGGLDLTPTRTEYVSEGIIYQQLSFKDRERTVSMELPSRWTARGSSGRLQLIPPDAKYAEGSIETTALDAPLPAWDDEALQALRTRALNAVPPTSQSVQVVGEQQNSLVLGGVHGGFEVVVSYKAVGETFKRSTVFVNLPNAQLTFRFTAPEADFPRLNGAFQRAVHSWQWK